MTKMNDNLTCGICHSTCKITDAINEETKQKDTFVCQYWHLNFLNDKLKKIIKLKKEV